MHHRDATTAIKLARKGLASTVGRVDFISPIFSAMVAAESLRETAVKEIRFSENATGYMAINGLRDAIDGTYRQPCRGGLQGLTYSQLTRLQFVEDVDFCNEIIGDLLYRQLGEGHFAAAMLAQIVGELHDNVSSHARGAGFSCAQVYKESNGKTRVEFGIADIGCGFLYNARKAQSDISTDGQAIRWALRKGTTSAKTDDWAQRLPVDALYSPFPESTDTTYNDNHHLGLGLFELHRAVRLLGGQLWLCSGGGTVAIAGGMPVIGNCPIDWQGVAIEFEVYVPEDEQPAVSHERYQSLRSKLKL